MNKNYVPILVGIVILLALSVFAWFSLEKMSLPTTADNTQAVLIVVNDFGQQMQKVTLTAPKEQVLQEMQDAYGPYVESRTIAKWAENPQTAPGRRTSSPWPARIDIVSAAPNKDGTYSVQGVVVEVTSEDIKKNTSSVQYPVTLTLTPRQTGWVISSYERMQQ